MPKEHWEDNWWLVMPDDTLLRGNRGGGLALMRAMHLTRPLGALLAALRLSPLVDAFDRFVARYRPAWSRWVPKGEAPRRYP